MAAKGEATTEFSSEGCGLECLSQTLPVTRGGEFHASILYFCILIDRMLLQQSTYVPDHLHEHPMHPPCHGCVPWPVSFSDASYWPGTGIHFLGSTTTTWSTYSVGVAPCWHSDATLGVAPPAGPSNAPLGWHHYADSCPLLGKNHFPWQSIGAGL